LSIVPTRLPSTNDPFHAGPGVRVRSWQALWRSIWPSLRFVLQTEVHVYSFAVAANILICFFPFLVAMILLCHYLLHWQAAVDVIFQTLNNYFPEDFGVNFRGYLMGVAFHKQFSWLSVFLLLFTANAIFTPLEVALNRIWRVRQNRSLLRNQAVSLGLIFACGVLMLASICLTAVNVRFMSTTFGASRFSALFQTIALRITALPITMLMIVVVYVLLPNAQIPVKRVIPASIAVGILLEISKWINVATWPYLRAKLRNEVPPFVQSISILLWAFIGTMIVLAGAEWSARVVVEQLDSNASPNPLPTNDAPLN
jgi:membrane protein